MKQIAIKVENEREFRSLMKHYEAKGWAWMGGDEPSDFKKTHVYEDVIEYNDNFKWPDRRCNNYSKYQIIPFTTLAQIVGIEVEPEEIIITQNRFVFTVTRNGAEINSCDDGTWHISKADSINIQPETLEALLTAFRSLTPPIGEKEK